MAASEISNSIEMMSRTHSNSECDDEESFVVLGRSPTSCIFNDQGQIILEEALKSITENVESMTKAKSPEPLSKSVVNVTNSFLQNGLQSLPKADVVMPENPEQRSFVSFCDLTNAEIGSKVDSLIAENTKLKATIEQNNIAMKKQCETILQWQEDVQKVHDSHKAKFLETKQYIEKLQMENTQLKENLEIAQEKIKELEDKCKRNYVVDKTCNENVQEFQLHAAEVKITDLELALQKLNLEGNAAKDQWQNEKTVLMDKAENLERELEKATALNDQLKLDLDKERMLMGDVQRKLDLEIQARLALEKMMGTQDKNNTEDIENMRQQLMNAQMHITSLQLAKNEDLQTINDKELELQELRKQVQETSLSSDVEAALRTQLDLYKADYEALLATKNTIVDEKNQFAEDLQNLQRRNQQLLEEVERLRGNDFVHVDRVTDTSSHSGSSTDHACPKCNFKFTNYQALENHVFRCIELDSLP